MSDINLAFNFDDKDFMDFLPEDRFDQLRSRWTDFNIHDPGVTTFEALQFSYEDLRYRYRMDIVDLLQGEKSNPLSVWSKKDFRPSYAICSDDYRQLLNQNYGVINNVVLPAESPETIPNTKPLTCLLNANVASDGYLDRDTAQDNLLHGRALGEYINRQSGSDSIIKEKVVDVNVCLNAAFISGVDPKECEVKLRAAIAEFLLPKLKEVDIRFTSVKQLLTSHKELAPIGRDSDRDVRDVEPAAMRKPCYRRFIIVSELYEMIQKLNYILNIESLEVGLPRKELKKSVLDLGEHTFTRLQTLTFNGKEFPKKSDAWQSIRPPEKPWEFALYPGKYKNLGAFNSVQLSFPPNYKIGNYLGKGNTTSSDEIKKNKTTHSFRGYLFFMDQIRANISMQMENFHNVFRMDGKLTPIAENEIKTNDFYKDIFPQKTEQDEVQLRDENYFKDKEESYDIESEFLGERANYLLALNGWGMVDDIPTVNQDFTLLELKMKFIELLRADEKTLSAVNADLNRIFRATSLVMLQRKLEVILQNDVEHVRILEHCFFQPVWTSDEDFNFQMTILLFKKPESGGCSTDSDRLIEFTKRMVRTFSPVHMVVNITWLNDDIRTFDGYLQTAFPPNDYFFFDKELGREQEYAMDYIVKNWLNNQT